MENFYLEYIIIIIYMFCVFVDNVNCYFWPWFKFDRYFRSYRSERRSKMKNYRILSMSSANAFIWYATWLYYSNWIVLSPTPENGRFRKTAIESATYANPTGFFAWMVTIVYLKLMQKKSKIEGGVLCFFNHLCKTHFRPCGRRFLKFSTF